MWREASFILGTIKLGLISMWFAMLGNDAVNGHGILPLPYIDLTDCTLHSCILFTRVSWLEHTYSLSSFGLFGFYLFDEQQVIGVNACAKPKNVQIYFSSTDCDTTRQTSKHPYPNLGVAQNSLIGKKQCSCPKWLIYKIYTMIHFLSLFGGQISCMYAV